MNTVSNLSPELRTLVSRSVAILGEVITRELGEKSFARIEDLRKKMAALRDLSHGEASKRVLEAYALLEPLSKKERIEVATAFTLMLEVMNACENAYRSYRLSQTYHEQQAQNHKKSATKDASLAPEAVIYVLTAHPTEARSPKNISAFHDLQTILIRVLKGFSEKREINSFDEAELRHSLEIAWRTPIVRNRSPRVKDEAEHIYSTALRDEVLTTLLDVSEREVPFYFRSWVGGDKDGHPGVDEKVLLESLTLSRERLVKISREFTQNVSKTLHLISNTDLLHAIAEIERDLKPLNKIETSDAKRVQKLRRDVRAFSIKYEKLIGASHPCLLRLKRVLHMFPGLVVPIEVRESSDVLMQPVQLRKKPAIDRMLALVARISKGGDPRWYTRGFIISMTESIDHIRAAAKKQKAAFGSIPLPIIPLFEQSEALKHSEKIVTAMIKDREIHRAAKENWNGFIEVMVGYSDSSKEGGVLPSRLNIANYLPRLEKTIQSHGLTPVFFHGSGGSIDRGGGSIEDQTAWWPKSARRRYKVTVQGEMVERSLATPEITKRQIQQIISSRAGENKATSESTEALNNFAQKVFDRYRETIQSPDFLKIVEHVTPYPYLNHLKIGSRPSKRAAQLTVSGLRAIPWILCWTQTRVLFPTWWGLGSAWENSSRDEKMLIKKAFADEPVFSSFIRALGFTLSKVELPIWNLYVEKSNLEPGQKRRALSDIEEELTKTLSFYRDLTGQKDLLWFRPWLQESIRLRSAMIHPLNCLQIMAERIDDAELLRITVTGIASGMLTTG